jgi:hypothetical protein
MAETEKLPKEKKITKKAVRKAIHEKLASALVEYKSSLDEKKFNNKIKKATNLFVVDITRASKKKVRTDSKMKVAIKK